MDLISFEDLVVQPCNSYFNLEKELQEVKSRLTLMEQRLKYLEKPKKQPKKPVKQDTDLKYEISKKIQNDADRKIRLINRNKKREENEELQLKRKEEWKKWDKEREEELERCNKIQEEQEIKKAENKKYWNSRREYWKKKESESNSFTSYTKAADASYTKKKSNDFEEYLKRNVDDNYLKSYWGKKLLEGKMYVL